MKCNISQAVDAVISKGKPVLLIDTCSLLDVVRVAYRKNIKHSHLVGAEKLLEKAENNELLLVITDTVEKEFNDNSLDVCIELEKHITKLETENQRLINTIESLNLSYKFNIHNLSGVKLPDTIREILDKILEKALIVDRDLGCSDKAHNRVERNQAPSRRGKSESKDCLIIEHYLMLATELRNANFQEKIIFITSNSNDYGEISSLKPPLDTEFSKVKIEYCNNFSWALNIAEDKNRAFSEE